jgi:response regulator NasT
MERTERKCSVLIAAASEKTANQIRSVLPSSYGTVSIQTSMARVKQTLSMDRYDLLLVHTPLPDEFGLQSVLDLAERFPSMGILLMVSKDTYEQTVYRTGDAGIMVLARPFSVQSFISSVQILQSLLKRIRRLTEENEKLRKKLEDERYISRAKALLIERQGITEGEAHKYIEQEAMNHSITRREVALHVIREAGRIVMIKY